MKNLLFRAIVVAAILAFPCVNSSMAQFRPGESSQAKSGSQSRTQTQTPRTQGSQTRQPATQGSQTRQPATQGSQNRQPATANQGSASKKQPDRPWKLSSRIHIEKGTNTGYLVVQLDLDEGYHVYSLNPAGSPSPTKLAVLPSNDLRVSSKFASDKAPLVIEKDPDFGRRIEKHKGQVQFFASIVVRQGVDLQKLAQEVQFSGQICSKSACQPIRQQTANATFAGFFEVPKKRNAANTKQMK